MKHKNHKVHDMEMKSSKHSHSHSHSHDHGSVEEMEINSWKRKLIGAWIFTIPIAFVMLLDRIFSINLLEFAGEWGMIAVILIFAFPVVFIFGFDTIKGRIRGLFTFYFNMDSLIALGSVVAYLTGIGAMFGLMQDYSGVSAMIMAFFITGKYVEAKARGRAGKEIKKLLELGAKKALILK